MEGRFDPIQGTEVGADVGPQLFEVRRVQGRLAEWAPDPRPDLFSWGTLSEAQLLVRDALAGSTAGAGDRLRALDREGYTAARGWARFHVLAYLAEVASMIEDRSAAARLANGLRPYAGQLIGPGLCPGPVDRYLGVLAATQGGWAESEAYFEGAIALETRLGLPLLRARTHLWYARMLLMRDQPGDRSRADGMLSSTLAMTGGFDAAGLRSDATELLEHE